MDSRQFPPNTVAYLNVPPRLNVRQIKNEVALLKPRKSAMKSLSTVRVCLTETVC